MKQIGPYWCIKCMVSVIVLFLLMGVSSAPVVAAPTTTLVAIHAAYHTETTPHYDRVVFQFSGNLPNTISIEYVPRLIADASGSVLPIKGNGILQLHFSPAYAHTSTGQSTVPARIQYSLPLVKEVVRSGDFEAVVSYGIGVSHKAEYRVYTFTNPTRIAIDFLP